MVPQEKHKPSVDEAASAFLNLAKAEKDCRNLFASSPPGIKAKILAIKRQMQAALETLNLCTSLELAIVSTKEKLEITSPHFKTNEGATSRYNTITDALIEAYPNFLMSPVIEEPTAAFLKFAGALADFGHLVQFEPQNRPENVREAWHKVLATLAQLNRRASSDFTFLDTLDDKGYPVIVSPSAGKKGLNAIDVLDVVAETLPTLNHISAFERLLDAVVRSQKAPSSSPPVEAAAPAHSTPSITTHMLQPVEQIATAFWEYRQAIEYYRNLLWEDTAQQNREISEASHRIHAAEHALNALIPLDLYTARDVRAKLLIIGSRTRGEDLTFEQITAAIAHEHPGFSEALSIIERTTAEARREEEGARLTRMAAAKNAPPTWQKPVASPHPISSRSTVAQKKGKHLRGFIVAGAFVVAAAGSCIGLGRVREISEAKQLQQAEDAIKHAIACDISRACPEDVASPPVHSLGVYYRGGVGAELELHTANPISPANSHQLSPEMIQALIEEAKRNGGKKTIPDASFADKTGILTYRIESGGGGREQILYQFESASAIDTGRTGR